MTEGFEVEEKLHNGSVLHSFAMLVNLLTEEVRQEFLWTLMFAYDIVIGRTTKEAIEEKLDKSR